MNRRLFSFAINAAAVLSLLLCAASMVMWYVTGDLPGPRYNNAAPSVAVTWEAESGGGGFRLARKRLLLPKVAVRGSNFFDSTSTRSFSAPQILELTLIHVNARDMALDGTGPIVPYLTGWSMQGRWLALTVPLAMLPAWWAFKKAAQWKRRRLGLCQDSGYDLRATPERCPECGAVASR